MPERLKDRFFSEQFILNLSKAIQDVYPGFNRKNFQQLVTVSDWKEKELKQKMRHTTECLAETLPAEYSDALKILLDVAPGFNDFDAMVFPDFVECYGLDAWDLSLPALEHFTRYSSSEFAIRPFIIHDPERVMQLMYRWAEDENLHVRRLASEGCRPRLPWAIALPDFKKDPSPILPVLEALKNDPSEYVRKSVANNLNDISKDHPNTVLDLCERWYGNSRNTDWIIKRACRTLLKAGDKRAMALFGFGNPDQVSVNNLVFDRNRLTIGEDLLICFQMNLGTEDSQNIRLEYALEFVKARGNRSRKVFQISETSFRPGKHNLQKKHSFRDLSTRKHYPGEHVIAIIVNGDEKIRSSIDLTDE